MKINKCWICGRTPEQLKDELNIITNINMLATPDFKALDKMLIEFSKDKREMLSDEVINKYFKNVRICNICISIIQCATWGFFIKE